MSTFTLRRGTPSDVPSIISLAFRAFDPTGTSPDANALFQGLRSPADIPLREAYMRRRFETSPSSVWMLAEEVATGKLAAASEWRVFLSEGYGEERDWEVSGWLEEGTALAERQRVLFEANNRERRESMRGPFVYLYFLATDPDFQRKGAGRQLLNWGCELADHLCVPAYLESSPDGEKVYPIFGFEALGRIPAEFPAMKFRRPSKLESEGKKAEARS